MNTINTETLNKALPIWLKDSKVVIVLVSEKEEYNNDIDSALLDKCTIVKLSDKVNA